MQKQMTNSKSPRAAVRINSKLDKRLVAYMAAAGAAGIGMMAAPQSAEAKIVYTPANISIGRNAGHVPLDLNNDGTPDFLFSNYQTQVAPLGFRNFFLNVTPAWKANGVVDYFNSKNFACASALPAHHQVGPQGPFQPNNSFILERSTGSAYSTVQFCPWAGAQSHKAYLGVKFNIGGQIHYGWIRMAVSGFSSIAVTGYAYETVPNKPISTGATSGPEKVSALMPADVIHSADPQPASLGMLACGADALAIWRRDDEMISG